MPIKKSSIKDVRRIKTRRERNIAVMSRLRSTVAKVGKAVGPEAASAALSKAKSLLDKAASKNHLHHKTAARKKSRLARAVNKLKK
ncbi:MAG: 30S ribosomal protein S20 [candidate division FCPU426 bacterium]